MKEQIITKERKKRKKIEIFLRASIFWISMSSTTSHNNSIERHSKSLTSSLRLLTSRTAEVCALVGTRTPRPAAPKGNPPRPANPPAGGTPLYGPAKGEGRPCMAAKGVGSTPGAPAMDSTSENLQAIVSIVSLIRLGWWREFWRLREGEKSRFLIVEIERDGIELLLLLLAKLFN